MKAAFVAFVAGVVFAIGLGLAGMTQPSKVLAFLDFTGAWDPSLAFVMIGAIGVHTFFARRALVANAPVFASKFTLPEKRDVDAALVGGSVLFGVGWGLGGYCPGPALTSLAAFAPTTLVFAASMAAGVFAFEAFTRARSRS